MKLTDFTKDTMVDEALGVKKQILWAMRNMLQCEPNTDQHLRWFDLFIHLALKYIEMIEAAQKTS